MFKGPPQSVALIEAGATAASKWWATGIGVSVLGAWAKLLTWWGSQQLGVKEVALAGSFFLTAAAVAAIGFLFASDVRGRAAAQVATIEARQGIATAMVAAAENASGHVASANGSVQLQRLPLSPPWPVKNYSMPGPDEEGWYAIAVEFAGGGDGLIKFLVVKGSNEAILRPGQIGFGATAVQT